MSESVKQTCTPLLGGVVAGGATSGALVFPFAIIVNNLSTCRDMSGTSIYRAETRAIETATNWSSVGLNLTVNVNAVPAIAPQALNVVGPASLNPTPIFWPLTAEYMDAWSIPAGGSRIEVGMLTASNLTPGTNVQVSGGWIYAVHFGASN